MPRILAIDYGEKRIGVAISDRTNKIALSLEVIINDDIDRSIFRINKIIDEYEIGTMVVGLPLGLKNVVTNQTTETLNFIDELEQVVKINIEKVDERFTSKLADKFLLNKKSKKLGDRDIKSAQIMLQDYLDKINK